jgi:hypothetical protein
LLAIYLVGYVSFGIYLNWPATKAPQKADQKTEAGIKFERRAASTEVPEVSEATRILAAAEVSANKTEPQNTEVDWRLEFNKGLVGTLPGGLIILMIAAYLERSKSGERIREFHLLGIKFNSKKSAMEPIAREIQSELKVLNFYRSTYSSGITKNVVSSPPTEERRTENNPMRPAS